MHSFEWSSKSWRLRLLDKCWLSIDFYELFITDFYGFLLTFYWPLQFFTDFLLTCTDFLRTISDFLLSSTDFLQTFTDFLRTSTDYLMACYSFPQGSTVFLLAYTLFANLFRMLDDNSPHGKRALKPVEPSNSLVWWEDGVNIGQTLCCFWAGQSCPWESCGCRSRYETNRTASQLCCWAVLSVSQRKNQYWPSVGFLAVHRQLNRTARRSLGRSVTTNNQILHDTKEWP